MAKKVLIVEDDEGMRDIYREMFEAEKDYQIEIEDNAAGALVKAEKGGYDLVILDIIMEPMTGDSFFVRLRDNPGTAELPVIIVSVLSPDTLSNLKEINHCRILQKPVRKESLLAAMRESIGRGANN